MNPNKAALEQTMKEEKEYRALGMIELRSIAHGYEAADRVAKTADVEYVTAQTTCPGKFIIILRGSISAVKASLDAAVQSGGNFVVDTFLLGNPDDQVFDALIHRFPYQETDAMGIVETRTAAAAIVAADQGVKASEVHLIGLGLASQLGGKGFCIFVGEVAAVQAAVECAASDSRVREKLIEKVIIPSPDRRLWELYYRQNEASLV